jgi:hypothetical protein
MKCIKRLLCFLEFHRWSVSKATGLDRHVCTGCGKTEFRYGQT